MGTIQYSYSAHQIIVIFVIFHFGTIGTSDIQYGTVRVKILVPKQMVPNIVKFGK